jgi:hypothetical protein
MNGPTRWKVILYTLALFFAGAICGAMVMSRISANAQSLRVDRTAEIATKIREKLKTSLDLKPGQLETIMPMIEKTSEELEASHRDDLKRISASVDALHTRIAPLLDAEQKQKLLGLEAQRRESLWQKYHYRPEVTNPTNH